MASLNCVGERALRFYQSKRAARAQITWTSRTGIAITHRAKLDHRHDHRIPRGLGFSIGRIRTLIERGFGQAGNRARPAHARLGGRPFPNVARPSQTRRLLDSCRTMRERPLFNVVMIEHPGSARWSTFPFSTRGCQVTSDGVGFLRRGKINLRQTKRAILDHNLPRSLFRGVGCRISEKSLREHDFKLSGSFVFVESEHVPEGCEAEVLEAARYATLYTDHYV